VRVVPAAITYRIPSPRPIAARGGSPPHTINLVSTPRNLSLPFVGALVRLDQHFHFSDRSQFIRERKPAVYSDSHRDNQHVRKLDDPRGFVRRKDQQHWIVFGYRGFRDLPRGRHAQRGGDSERHSNRSCGRVHTFGIALFRRLHGHTSFRRRGSRYRRPACGTFRRHRFRIKQSRDLRSCSFALRADREYDHTSMRRNSDFLAQQQSPFRVRSDRRRRDSDSRTL